MRPHRLTGDGDNSPALPFQHKQSVEVYVRHTKDCPQQARGRHFHKYACRNISTSTKTVLRVSAKTESWALAERKAQEVRDSWIPELAELRLLRAEKEMARLRIKADSLYVHDMKTVTRRG